MAFDFPASPTEGQTYAPAGGATYIYQSGVWRVVTVPAPPPSDGNVYEMINGVWRLAKQAFHPTASFNVTVPSTARLAKIVAVFNHSVAGSASMRWSLDGSTFLSGASDYSYIGQNFFGGTTANGKIATTNTNAIPLYITNDNLALPSHFEAVLTTKKPAQDCFAMRTRQSAYNNAAANAFVDQLVYSYSVNAAAMAATQLAAFQVFPTGTWEPSGDTTVEVEWVY